MASNFIEVLRWRGMIHDVMPGAEAHLLEKMRSAYVGFDPTADSLHIGNLVPIMLLAHYQKCGHKPFALVGGATGMIGDPSGKSTERNFLDEKALRHNQEAIKNQLSHFLNFDNDKKNAAVMVNNYDWMKDFSFLDFIRDVGKHITVNYMMAKDSVKNRIAAESSDGMSFTEFTYQLVQGYDFLHLFETKDCTIQMGGSDQWGNITTGTELIRRVANGKGYAITCPLITKSDGSKFGKSEGGNVWLDANRTSPYKFYQYWLNSSDDDANKYIKIFTFLEEHEILNLIELHQDQPHLRLLQKRLAQEITTMVHGQAIFENAKMASTILYSKSFKSDIQTLDEVTFLDIFEGVPTAELPKDLIANGLDMIAALSAETKFLESNGEARRALKENSISVNKEKVGEDYKISEFDLINNTYIIINRGKRSTFIIRVV
ncbi:tyrosine--tRNA ligase [Flavobacteriaceae bacterium]|jgi:tyrosyl-tRNA synthetase|nr:tyrosine--tRNA ligase [Flavobacteriaceae bacterium]|tara:strand:+ start:1446 stop:2741 length:1296 start_codon:yes stop_codon:yes gene_type:complete